MSQAFYFDDPEGNGVELYWDRPRSGWQWDGATVRMGTLPLDPNAFLQEHLDEHVRLARCGPRRSATCTSRWATSTPPRPSTSTCSASTTTARFGDQALFVSAGGYHHHVGMNTWESRGAGPRTPALGLGQVALRLPDADALGALADRLRSASVAVQHDGRELLFADPWRNAVRAGLLP